MTCHVLVKSDSRLKLKKMKGKRSHWFCDEKRISTVAHNPYIQVSESGINFSPATVTNGFTRERSKKIGKFLIGFDEKSKQEKQNINRRR